MNMNTFFFLAVILVVAMPLGCSTISSTTSKGESPSITEDISPEEASLPVEETKPAESQETPPPLEEAIPEPMEKEASVEAKPKTSLLPGGPTIHDVAVLLNTLKLTPPKITIRKGDTVRWQNKDNKKHFLASVPGSGEGSQLEIFSLMEPGVVFEHTFKTSGEFPYFCFIHNQMRGHITVVQ